MKRIATMLVFFFLPCTGCGPDFSIDTDSLYGKVVVTCGSETLTLHGPGIGLDYDYFGGCQPDSEWAVVTQPVGQICKVSKDGDDITLACTDIPYTIGGTVSGLYRELPLTYKIGLLGRGLRFRIPTIKTMFVSQDGPFVIEGTHLTETQYTVTAGTVSGQTCTVANGEGKVLDQSITNIAVTCTPNYTLTGSIAGQTGSVVLRSGDSNITVDAAATTFSLGTLHTESYDVQVLTAPAGQTCTVEHASGTRPGDTVSDVAVTCTNRISQVGGTVTGHTGTVTLGNGNDTLTVATNASTYHFDSIYGSPYAIEVVTSPAGQVCTVQNSHGTTGDANVINANVTCSSNRSVGGTVTGHTGAFVVSNGNMTLPIAATDSNYHFTVASGASYDIRVSQQPAGQHCQVANGTGTASADVTNASINCAAAYTLSFTVNGLDPNDARQVTVQESNNTPMSVAGGTHQFDQTYPSAATYDVHVVSSPNALGCWVENNTGTVSGNISDITVHCAVAATLVIGQSDLVHSDTGTTASTLSYVYGSPYVAPSGKLYVPDYDNNRVLGFNQVPQTNGASADFVLGQAGFATSTCAVSSTGLCSPQTLSGDGNKLIITDFGSHRIVIHNTLPTVSNAAADVVVGQPDKTTSSPTAAQAKLSAPQGAFIGAGKLIVTDSSNNRVLIWDTIPTADGQPADLVLGQFNFVTSTSGTAANKLWIPTDAWTDGTKLLVADLANNRILIWNTFPTTNGQAADVVVGQADMTTSTESAAATGFYFPQVMAVRAGRLYVGDAGNNRVVWFNTIPTTNGATADGVLGQSKFGVATGWPTSSTSMAPVGLCATDTQLLVTDNNGRRILIFNHPQ